MFCCHAAVFQHKNLLATRCQAIPQRKTERKRKVGMSRADRVSVGVHMKNHRQRKEKKEKQNIARAERFVLSTSKFYDPGDPNDPPSNDVPPSASSSTEKATEDTVVLWEERRDGELVETMPV
jgi:hypothetical protein